MKNIGFVGLGNMGSKMARNLLKAGYNVFGYDVNYKLIASLPEHGMKKVLSLKELSKNMDVIITMLPNGDVVENVLNEILTNIKNRPIIIDCSTIDVNKCKFLNNFCLSKNINFLDAPVSGGTKGAADGTLTFMVGGKEKICSQITLLLEKMGSKVIYCGENGSGQATKLCNNMLLATTMIGVSESINMAKNLNLSIETLFKVLSTATGSCWAINSYFPVKDMGPSSPADNNFLPGFSAKLMAKDLKLAINAARDSGSKTDFGNMAESVYSKMANGENGDKDFSAVINEVN